MIRNIPCHDSERPQTLKPVNVDRQGFDQLFLLARFVEDVPAILTLALTRGLRGTGVPIKILPFPKTLRQLHPSGIDWLFSSVPR